MDGEVQSVSDSANERVRIPLCGCERELLATDLRICRDLERSKGADGAKMELSPQKNVWARVATLSLIPCGHQFGINIKELIDHGICAETRAGEVAAGFADLSSARGVSQ